MLKDYVLAAINDAGNIETISTSSYAAQLCLPFLIGLQPPNKNSTMSLDDAANAMMMCATMGWRDHCQLHARLIFQALAKYDMKRGKFTGGALMQGQALGGYTYMMMDVMRRLSACGLRINRNAVARGSV